MNSFIIICQMRGEHAVAGEWVVGGDEWEWLGLAEEELPISTV